MREISAVMLMFPELATTMAAILCGPLCAAYGLPGSVFELHASDEELNRALKLVGAFYGDEYELIAPSGPIGESVHECNGTGASLVLVDLRSLAQDSASHVGAQRAHRLQLSAKGDPTVVVLQLADGRNAGADHDEGRPRRVLDVGRAREALRSSIEIDRIDARLDADRLVAALDRERGVYGQHWIEICGGFAQALVKEIKSDAGSYNVRLARSLFGDPRGLNTQLWFCLAATVRHAVRVGLIAWPDEVANTLVRAFSRDARFDLMKLSREMAISSYEAASGIH